MHRTQMAAAEEHHYSPATEGGKHSGLVAKKVSRAMTSEYNAFKQHLNESTEILGYFPVGQTHDDLWSGTPADTVLTRTNHSLIMNRAASSITKEQRDAAVVPRFTTGAPSTKMSFLEATKTRGN